MGRIAGRTLGSANAPVPGLVAGPGSCLRQVAGPLQLLALERAFQRRIVRKLLVACDTCTGVTRGVAKAIAGELRDRNTEADACRAREVRNLDP